CRSARSASRCGGSSPSSPTASRRTSAGERLEFAQEAFRNLRDSLADAEVALSRFLDRNRSGLSSPRLDLERERLERRVDIVQSVYRSVADELQEARIALARDLPVFNVIEAPRPALYREYPLRKRMTLFAAALGALLAIAWVALRASYRRIRDLDPVGYDELRTAVTGAPRG
ncbi:MAG: hypothetical protein ACM357_06125, partial [Gemmatimonadota bacterium]